MFNIVGKFLLRNRLLEKAIEEVLMEEQSLRQSNNTGFDIWGANNLAWKEGDTPGKKAILGMAGHITILRIDTSLMILDQHLSWSYGKHNGSGKMKKEESNGNPR